MKKIIILVGVLLLGGLWFYAATPPDDFAFDPTPPAPVVVDDTETETAVEDGSVARELTEEEKASIATLMETAKDNPTEVLMSTSLGDITIELFPNVAPGTVDNFLTLAGEGFYDGIAFHRVIESFMIQGGDPNSKDDDPANDGQGGPGYSFNDEINPHALGLSVDAIAALERSGYEFAIDIPSLPMVRGVLAMANSGANTNGSQFFIVTQQDQTQLNGKHTVFGEVISGMDIVATIAAVDVEDGSDRPIVPVLIESISVVE